MESLLPSQVALNLLTKPSHSVNIFKYLGHVSSAYCVLSRLCKATQESFSTNDIAFLRILSKEELDFKFYITDLCSFMPVETLRFYSLRVDLSDPEDIRYFEQICFQLIQFDKENQGLEYSEENLCIVNYDGSPQLMNPFIKADEITQEIEQTQKLESDPNKTQKLKQMLDVVKQACVRTYLNLKEVKIDGELSSELLDLLIKRKPYLLKYPFKSISVKNKDLPDILQAKSIILKNTMKCLNKYTEILQRETTFRDIFYNFYYEFMEEHIKQIKCSSKILTVQTYTTINPLEFVSLLGNHPTMLKDAEVVLLNILRNVDTVQNWYKFAKAMLTNEEEVFAPKMKHFELTTYGYGRFNGTFLSLVDQGVSKLYQTHPDFQRLIVHSRYERRYKGPTPKGRQLEHIIKEGEWPMMNKVNIISHAENTTYSYCIQFETGNFNAEVFCDTHEDSLIFGNILKLDFTNIMSVELVPVPKIPEEILENANRILVAPKGNIPYPEIFTEEGD
ncbi:unnamed protein product [Moneuplotes crassus]|uniref:Uncharacterized protein n=1 Tax=Euplotes crassus TaxID=5936 RepID=A0AAD1UJX9_EUPCR|nr:unnamed protein product [Moneuplotes crassus]